MSCIISDKANIGVNLIHGENVIIEDGVTIGRCMERNTITL